MDQALDRGPSAPRPRPRRDAALRFPAARHGCLQHRRRARDPPPVLRAEPRRPRRDLGRGALPDPRPSRRGRPDPRLPAHGRLRRGGPVRRAERSAGQRADKKTAQRKRLASTTLDTSLAAGAAEVERRRRGDGMGQRSARPSRPSATWLLSPHRLDILDIAVAAAAVGRGVGGRGRAPPRRTQEPRPVGPLRQPASSALPTYGSFSGAAASCPVSAPLPPRHLGSPDSPTRYCLHNRDC